MVKLTESLGAMMSLAANVRYHRTQQGLSQVALAEIAGMSHPRISEIESGKGNPTIKTVDAIAAALGVEAQDLIRTPSQKILSAL